MRLAPEIRGAGIPKEVPLGNGPLEDALSSTSRGPYPESIWAPVGQLQEGAQRKSVAIRSPGARSDATPGHSRPGRALKVRIG